VVSLGARVLFGFCCRRWEQGNLVLVRCSGVKSWVLVLVLGSSIAEAWRWSVFGVVWEAIS
jgi:hypothetical protein